MKSADQLMLSIGALLATERQKRGIAVEKAAKETRMRPARIRDMENDDLSHFTNPSYARMFIIAYAKYLDIPMQTIREHLPDRGESGSEDYHYIAATGHELPSLRRDLVSRPVRRGWLPAVVVTSLVCVVVAVILLVAYIFINVPRLVSSGEENVASQPTPSPTPKVVREVVYVPEPRIDNLPAATPTPVAATTSLPATFTDPAHLLAPPAPAPVGTLGEAPSQPPATLQSAVNGGTPSNDDRAFLLSTLPGAATPAPGLTPPPIVR